jgi:hypothetical protein
LACDSDNDVGQRGARPPNRNHKRSTDTKIAHALAVKP